MELSYILSAIKQYGTLGGVFSVGFIFLTKYWMTANAERARKAEAYRQSEERLRAQLVAQTTAANENTMITIREERKLHEVNTKAFFDILDRNTRSLEKLVESIAAHGKNLDLVRDSVMEIKGGLKT